MHPGSTIVEGCNWEGVALSPAAPVPSPEAVSNSQCCAFILPEDKKRKFAALRESILDKKSSSIKTLQRLAGKITSFCIAVPAAQLYCREIFKATAGYKKSAQPVKIHSLLREEIEHWRFLDSWERTLPWPSERHIVLEILSDASDFAWGGVIRSPGPHPSRSEIIGLPPPASPLL